MSALLAFVIDHPFAVVAGLLGVGLAGLVGMALIPTVTVLVDLGDEEER